MEDNTRNPIDELFRNKLNENQPVSEDSLWEEVEGIMDSRKKKKRFLILMWTILLMGICTTGYFLIPNKAGKTTYAIVAPQSSVSSQNSASNQTVNSNSAGSNTSDIKEDSSSISNSNSASSIASTQSKNVLNANDNLNTTSSANNVAGKTSSSANNHNASVGSRKHKPGISNAQQVSATSALQNGSLNNNVPDTTIAATVKPDSSTNTSIGVPTINANRYLSLKGNPTSSKEELVDTSAKKQVAQPDDQSKIKKPTHKSIMKWYVEADGAYIDNFHFVSAPTSASPYYDNIRGSDERPLLTPNYMLKVGVVRKNIQFNSGLGITNVGEKIEYKNHDDSTGNTIIRNDSVFARNGSFVNTYLTVPLQVTFLFPVKGIRFQLGFGTDAFFPLKWNSYYLNQQVDELQNPGSLKMVNSVVLNVNMNFGLQVPFTRHWSGIASFEFSRDVSNVFKSSYGIRQEYLGVGGNLGIRYSFAR